MKDNTDRVAHVFNSTFVVLLILLLFFITFWVLGNERNERKKSNLNQKVISELSQPVDEAFDGYVRDYKNGIYGFNLAGGQFRLALSTILASHTNLEVVACVSEAGGQFGVNYTVIFREKK